MADSSGFRRTRPAAVGDWRERAECARFYAASPVWADRMWTFEDAAGDDPVDPVPRTMARRICELCPVRLECLADATAGGIQYGLFGGFRRNQRRALGNMAESDGVTVYSRSGEDLDARIQAFRDWLRKHPEALKRVESEDHRLKQARRRAQRRRSVPANRASAQTAGDVPALFQ